MPSIAILIILHSIEYTLTFNIGIMKNFQHVSTLTKHNHTQKKKQLIPIYYTECLFYGCKQVLIDAYHVGKPTIISLHFNLIQ